MASVNLTSCTKPESRSHSIKSKKLQSHSNGCKSLSFALLNAQSLRNKVHIINEFKSEHNLDIFFFTESWLKYNDSYEIGLLENNGEYCFLNAPRIDRTGGGVGCLYKSSLTVTKIETPPSKTFEHLAVMIRTKGKHFKVITIYRPEPSSKNRYTMSEFFDEFSALIAQHQNSKSELVITGDFNIHMNKPTNPNTIKLLTVLETFNMTQHVTKSTHKDGNILDLIITRKPFPVSDCVVDEYISDHAAVLCSIQIPSSRLTHRKIQYRNTRKIDIASFKIGIKQTIQAKSQNKPLGSLPIDILVDMYDSIEQVLEKHAPIMEKTVTERKPTPWSNKDIKVSKIEKRQAERRWRRTRNPQDNKQFRQKVNAHNKMLANLKAKDLAEKIRLNKNNSKALYKIINSSLNRKQPSPLPTNTTDVTLAGEFALFFDRKIEKIRSDLDANVRNPRPNPTVYQGLTFDNFKILTDNDTLKLLNTMSTKHCQLDPIPTWLLKECTDELLPLLTAIINKSLQTGFMPDKLKHALIRPQLKKPNLETIMKNYRPVSNLAFLGKLIESAVITQYTSHLDSNGLQDNRQSAYKKAHSTETLLTKIHNDIMIALDQGKLSMLVLLDLSAAFDTIDHDILLKRLEYSYGLRGSVLKWFESYLRCRTSSVLINQSLSPKSAIKYGVPQGSKLGPILFNNYIAPISNIAQRNGIEDQKYADDEQLMLSFKTEPIANQYDAVQKIENCIVQIKKFLLDNKLCCNSDKTELIIIGSREQLKKLHVSSIKVDNANISSGQTVRNLGIIFDNEMKMEKHINKMCQSLYYNIRNLSLIRKSLTKEDTKSLVNALVTPHLDYGNALLYGISNKLISKLQVAQNSAVRLIEKVRKSEHITPHRKNLHWLPIKARIEYKILTTTWNSLNNHAPDYLTNLLNVTTPHYGLRNHGSTILMVPNYHNNKYGPRSFARASPDLWNKLPITLRNKPTLKTFKTGLKTHLFTQYYP